MYDGFMVVMHMWGVFTIACRFKVNPNAENFTKEGVFSKDLWNSKH